MLGSILISLGVFILNLGVFILNSFVSLFAKQDRVDPKCGADATPGLFVFHFMARSEILPSLQIRLSVENLLDKDYH